MFHGKTNISVYITFKSTGCYLLRSKSFSHSVGSSRTCLYTCSQKIIAGKAMPVLGNKGRGSINI